MILFFNVYLQAMSSSKLINLYFELPQGGNYCMQVNPNFLRLEYKKSDKNIVPCPQELRTFRDDDIKNVLEKTLEPKLSQSDFVALKSALQIIVMMYYVRSLKLYKMYPQFIHHQEETGLCIGQLNASVYLDFLRLLPAPVTIVFRNVKYDLIKQFDLLIEKGRMPYISQPVRLVLDEQDCMIGLIQSGFFDFLYKHRPVHLQINTIPLDFNLSISSNRERLDGAFSLLAYLPTLKGLSIYVNHDEILLGLVRFFKSYSMNQLLDLSLNGNFYDESLISFTKVFHAFPNLRSLTLEGEFEDEGLTSLGNKIGNLKHLQKLKVFGNFRSETSLISNLEKSFDKILELNIKGYSDDSTPDLET